MGMIGAGEGNIGSQTGWDFSSSPSLSLILQNPGVQITSQSESYMRPWSWLLSFCTKQSLVKSLSTGYKLSGLFRSMHVQEKKLQLVAKNQFSQRSYIRNQKQLHTEVRGRVHRNGKWDPRDLYGAPTVSAATCQRGSVRRLE